MAFTAKIADLIAKDKTGLLDKHESWERVRLSEIADILNGAPFDSTHFNTTSGIALTRIRDVLAGESSTYYSGEYDDAYLLKKGDLLIGMDGDFNTGYWGSQTALLNQRVCKLTPSAEFYEKALLGYVLPGYLAAINANTPSITVKHLSSKTVGEIQLPLPPRAEQTRIVEKLEELLSDLDAGVAELKAAQRKLAQYRQSLLRAAVEGALTADWRARRRPTSPQPIPYQGVGATAADASCSAHDEAKMPTHARPYAPASAHLHAPAPARMQSSLPRTASGNPAPLSPRGRGAGGEGANDGNTPSPALLRQRARDMRHEPTPQEHQLWQQLRAKRFASYKFRRQQPIGRYIVDFVCFAERLIVELDGGQHADAAAYDAQRDAWLQAQGFRVLRFWNNEWTEHTDAVLDAIWTALAFADTGAAAPPPLPNPSPARGEGLESETGAELLQRILSERRARWERKQLAKFAEQGKAPPKGWQAKYPEPAAPDLTDASSLPQGWAWATVDQLANVGTGVTPLRSKKSYFEGGDIPWTTSGALNEEIVTSPSEHVTKLAVAECRLDLYPIGTLLVAMYGEGKTRGKCAELTFPSTINQAIAAIVLEGEATEVSAHLKTFFLDAYEAMRKQASGGVQPNLNLQIIKNLCIPLPPLSEQTEIQARLEEQLAGYRQLKDSTSIAIEQSIAQRKNILKAAFSGQLVPQDPNDEPASALLARIRAQREANAGTPARKRGRKAKGAA